MRTRKAKRASTRHETRTTRKFQTTLRLPRKLYEQAKLFVEREKTGSVNDFIVNALAVYMRAMERKAIDDAFIGMAGDRQYQREALRIAGEFAVSDAEALDLSERDLVGA